MTPAFLLQRPMALGALLILLSELFLVLSGLSIKQLSANIPTPEIVFMRNAFAVLLLMPWLIKKGSSALQTNLLRFHILRAVVGVVAMTSLFYSWGHLPLAQAALLKQTAPFFIPLIAFWWLGESISWLTKASLLIGFIGVAVVLNPQEGTLNLVMLIALFGACLSAVAKVTVRRMSKIEGAQKIVFYFACFSTLLAAIPAFWVWVSPTWVQWGWLLLLAVTSTLAQLCLSKGYGLAPAGQLGPFTYASIAFASLLGWWLWDETLSWNTLTGIVLIVAAGILAMHAGNKPQEKTYRA